MRAQESPMALVKVWRAERPRQTQGPAAALRTLEGVDAADGCIVTDQWHDERKYPAMIAAKDNSV